MIIKCNSKKGVQGTVQMNDIKLGSNKYSRKCSYIMQDDNLYASFTVHESMMMAANLKIAGITSDEKNLIVCINAVTMNEEAHQ